MSKKRRANPSVPFCTGMPWLFLTQRQCADVLRCGTACGQDGADEERKAFPVSAKVPFHGSLFHSSGKNQRRTLILWEDFCGRKDIAKTENRRSGLPGPPGCRRSQGSGRGSLEEKRKRRCTAGKCSEETKPARGPFRFYSSSKKYLPLIGMRKRREEIGCFHYSIFGRRDKKPGCAARSAGTSCISVWENRRKNG